MGCASSKRIEAAAAGPYRPAPTSFAVFDINAIEEPWLKHLNNTNTPLPQDKPTVLHKLNNILDSTEAPQSWDQVSKVLQDLKPVITKPPPTPTPCKTNSFHTLEELDAKLNSKPIKTNSKKNELVEVEVERENNSSIKPLKDNIFIVRDRLERQKESSNYERSRWDPMSQFPEKCPPGGKEGVVIYTTSLGGVRKTFEDCNRARDVLEGHRVVYDERDVSLHGEFLKEVKELLGEGLALPRVFVKGRYLGGLEELLELNETGRLGRILNATRVERGIGRHSCGGCGGARFVPCFQCGGSCKLNVPAGGAGGGGGGIHKERCPNCNENGLVHCPACLSL